MVDVHCGSPDGFGLPGKLLAARFVDVEIDHISDLTYIGEYLFKYYYSLHIKAREALSEP